MAVNIHQDFSHNFGTAKAKLCASVSSKWCCMVSIGIAFSFGLDLDDTLDSEVVMFRPGLKPWAGPSQAQISRAQPKPKAQALISQSLSRGPKPRLSM
jgi:hypothetical protein